MEGLNLSYRNAARLLGRKENWAKRLVTKAFGEDVCNKALECSRSNLNAAKLLMVAYFESKFTDEDREMEIALQKPFGVYEDEDDM